MHTTQLGKPNRRKVNIFATVGVITAAMSLITATTSSPASAQSYFSKPITVNQRYFPRSYFSKPITVNQRYFPPIVQPYNVNGFGYSSPSVNLNPFNGFPIRSNGFARTRVINSTLYNPVLVSPWIRNSTIVNPVIVPRGVYPAYRRSRVIINW